MSDVRCSTVKCSQFLFVASRFSFVSFFVGRFERAKQKRKTCWKHNDICMKLMVSTNDIDSNGLAYTKEGDRGVSWFIDTQLSRTSSKFNHFHHQRNQSWDSEIQIADAKLQRLSHTCFLNIHHQSLRVWRVESGKSFGLAWLSFSSLSNVCLSVAIAHIAFIIFRSIGE